MKKQLLIIAGLLSSTISFAQTERANRGIEVMHPTVDGFFSPVTAAQKGTKLSDTLILLNNSYAEQYDTAITGTYDAVTPFDTGYIFGINKFGDIGFAEQYGFNYKTDTTLNILGIYSVWGGTISPTSTRTINLKIWNRGTQVAIGPTGGKKYSNGMPNTAVTTLVRSVKAIGIGQGSAPDTFKAIYFPTQLTGVNYPFYVGYDMSPYTWTSLTPADTFAVRSTRGGKGNLVGNYTLSGTDTILTTRNAVKNSSNVWRDAYIDMGYVRNLSMSPIIRFKSSVSVHGVTRNNLTFYGNYPNPATTNTNVKFSLSQKADVSIQVIDMAGRAVNNISVQALTAGEHEISIPTGRLATGTYTYLVSTSEGDRIASQFDVIR